MTTPNNDIPEPGWTMDDLHALNAEAKQRAARALHERLLRRAKTERWQRKDHHALPQDQLDLLRLPQRDR
jgi:hypothetical protein